MTNALPPSGATPAQQINNLAKQVNRLTEKNGKLQAENENLDKWCREAAAERDEALKKLESAARENKELHEINAELCQTRDVLVDRLGVLEGAASSEDQTDSGSELVDG